MAQVKKLLGTLVVLLVLAVVADFGAAAYAEYRVSRELRSALSLSADPDVRINGVPFLTQAIGGDYRSVQIKAAGVPVPDLGQVTLTATLHGVRLPASQVISGDVHHVTADSVDASVRISATTLGQFLKIPDLTVSEPPDAKSGGGPRRSITMTGTVDVLGLKQKLSVDATLSVVPGGAKVTATRLDLGANGGTGSFAEGLLGGLLSRLSVTIDASAIPFGIVPSTVSADGSDIVVSGNGTNVTIIDTPASGR